MNKRFDTLLIHAGEEPDKATGAIAPVLHRTKTYAQKFGKIAPYEYSRGKNPTRSQLEEKLAILDGGKYATTFSSGVAATSAFFLTLNTGDHVLCCQEVYGGTYRLLDKILSKFGISTDYVDFTSEKSILDNIKTNTKYLFVETPTNPSLHVIDLEIVNKVSKATGIPFVVDSTFAPPCTTKPLEYGAKVVIHSLSKYIAGHNDVLGGALITNDEKLNEEFYFIMRSVGAILSPDECYRTLQGIKTLSIRWKRVSGTARNVAALLFMNSINDGKVKRVNYPNMAEKINPQMKNGYGGVLSFELNEKYHNLSSIKKFVDNATKSGVIIYGESLASPETILAYPPLMSHKSLPKAIQKSLGISDGFFRLSVGFEDPSDIMESLEAGLDSL